MYYENIYLMLIWKMCAFASIFYDAKSDALIDKTTKREHLYEVKSIAFILLGIVPLLIMVYLTNESLLVMLLRKAIMVAGGYIFMRAGMFNLVYNYYRDIDYYFVGTTNTFDTYLQLLQRIEFEGIQIRRRTIPFPALRIFYFICFIVGLIL